MFSEAGPLVELGDQPVPDGSGLVQAPPEALSATLLEFIDRHALLLDPSEVAEVEYPRPLAVGQFEDFVVGGTKQMLAEDLARIHRIEPVGVVRLDELSAFAAVERRAVGRNRDEDVVLTELQTFGGLDRGDQVGDAGETQ